MPDEKPGPCGCEKTAKGWYCATDQKDLADADLKAGACPTCEKKPAKVDYCVKTLPGQKLPDRARITHECAACGEKGDVEADVKHKDDCKKKAGTLKKVCSKSGAAPHVTLPKD